MGAPPGPYGSAAQTYWQAGWISPLPLPPRKKALPPKDFTGAGGAWPSFADVFAWCEDSADGNVGLRMPYHVIGIDVDAYGDKLGAQTLAIAEGMYGALPPTWRSTSRDDGVSGIRFFRVPEGLAWPGELSGGGVEIIQTRHRYAVVWPSVHPSGGTYRWVNADGVVSTVIPAPDELPWLPTAWVEALTAGQMAVDVARNAIEHNEAIAWLLSKRSNDAMTLPCPRMQQVIDDAVSSLSAGGDGHPVGRDAALRIVRLADEAHAGSLTALGAVRAAFLSNVCDSNRVFLGKTVRSATEGAYEWSELVSSAVGLVSANSTGMATCDCDGQLTGAIVGAGSVPQAPTDQTADGTTVPEATPQESQAAAEAIANPIAAAFEKHSMNGAEFLFDVPATIPTVWGDGETVIWPEGESLMLVGPPGVGKTTLTGQILRGLLGLQDEVLGQPIRQARKVLYLAMDRPAQIRRAFARTFDGDDIDPIADRVDFWLGPPPGDAAQHTNMLLTMATTRGYDVVILDSLKDAAIGLTDDETASGYNRARQALLAEGIQVLELHHMVKRGTNGTKPTELADVYGSAWLTAGAGSVVLLWGAAGDPVVEVRHLKQPMDEFGPVKVAHDHAVGTTDIFAEGDALGIVTASGAGGMTPRDLARVLYQTENPSESHLVRARRKLVALTESGHLERDDKLRDGPAGGKPQSVYRAPNNTERPTEHRDPVGGGQTKEHSPNRNHVSAGQTTQRPNKPNEQPGTTNDAPSPISEGVGSPVASDEKTDEFDDAIEALADADMLADDPEVEP